MAGMAAVSNNRKFSPGGYRYPTAPTFSFSYTPGVNDPCTTATGCDHPASCTWYS
ncbi:hypothetical protein M405DRAFT_808900 [Rhizopogon salebrosus TDB-379]|nr:hypothetical protein M405DRAFT_808900 [Rhizopogon salebrosus TDB-379]